MPISRDEILERLTRHFEQLGYEAKPYYDKLEARIPLYCFKRTNGGVTDEVVVDIVTDVHLSREEHLPELHLEGGIHIPSASPVRFFQYYLPRSRVYWAHSADVEAGAGYDGFKDACSDVGIGILRVTEFDIEVVVEATALSEAASEKAEGLISRLRLRQQTRRQASASMAQLLTDQQDEFIHYLVIYGQPRFQLRTVAPRTQQDTSFVLLNQLGQLHNVSYADSLRRIARDFYHGEKRPDREIASKAVEELWQSALGVDYPELQRDFEPVLLLNPSYRDHFLHGFQVFLLGAIIIDALHSSRAVQAFQAFHGTPLDVAWLAAATYHDFNYPIQECESLMQTFFRKALHVDSNGPMVHFDIESVVVRNELLEKMMGISTAIGCEWDDCALRFVLGRAGVNRNHAMLGALTFLTKMQSSSALSETARFAAAASILVHDWRNWRPLRGESEAGCETWESAFAASSRLPELRFEAMPLAFLLTFCDSVQEWGRQGRDYDRVHPRLEAMSAGEAGVSIHLSIDDRVSWSNKQQELGMLAEFLRDDTFRVTLDCSSTGATVTIPMGAPSRA